MIPLAKLPAAVISSCSRYRYFLSRRLSASARVVTFIGLNPSTADATRDDPTIRRCIDFAKRWDAGLLVMVNLFSLRSTNPDALRTNPEPVGPDTDLWLDRVVAEADLSVAAWGNDGVYLGRAEAIKRRFEGRLHALALNKSGMPKHPLYVRADTAVFPY